MNHEQRKPIDETAIVTNKRITKYFNMKRGLKVFYLVVGAGIVVAGVTYLYNLRGRYEYKALFSEATGLKKGSKVTVLGIEVGKVQSIELYEDSVVAHFWVKGIKLKDHATLTLEPLNIFGDVELALYPGKGEWLSEGSTIPGYSKKGLGKTIASLGIFVEHLDSLTSDMMRLTSDAHISFNETAKGLEQLLTSLEREVKMTLQSARDIAQSTHGVLNETAENLTTIIENLRNISGGLNSLLEATDTSFASSLYAMSNITLRMDTLVSFLSAGKGTAGKLLVSDSLYSRIDSALISLKGLLDDIKKNPKRYFSVF